MPMHHDNVVVAIQSANKTFREYDFDKTQDTSSCNLVIPFGTEYSFLIKVLDDVRRRAVVTIDGMDAFDLILDKGNHSIERFLETAKKFKFVKADSPGVSDPTSSFNGKICVKICREKPLFHMPLLRVPDYNEPPYWPKYLMPDRDMWCDTQIICGTSEFKSTYAAESNQVMYCSTDVPRGGEIGATVEGSKSDQRFLNTHWNGDDMPYSFFNFTVRGKVLQAGYCVECGEKLVAGHKFCGHCGTRV